MPKAAKTLTSREVNAITKVGLTALGGADGLYLSVKDSGTRSYVDRYRVRNTGRRTMIGLGSVADISLKDARAKAMELRKVVDHSICLSNFPIMSPASANVSLNVPASLPDTVNAIAYSLSPMFSPGKIKARKCEPGNQHNGKLHQQNNSR